MPASSSNFPGQSSFRVSPYLSASRRTSSSISAPTYHDSPVIDNDLEAAFLPERARADFRVCSKQVYLTYSQVGDCVPETVRDMLMAHKKTPKYWHLAVEQHGNGGIHWHVIVIFDKSPGTRGTHQFDVAGLHPNIRFIKADPSGKNLRRVWDYIHKSSDTVHRGNWSGPTKIEDQGSKKNWSKIAAATSRADAAELLIALQPKERITAFGNTEAWLNATFPEEKKTYVHPEGMADFVSLPRAMVDWVTAYIQSENPVLRPKALIVWGPSRTGKTKWARSLGHHIYMNTAFNMDELKDLDTAEYIVFDDISPDSFPGYKGWIGAQEEFTVTDKYRPKKTIRFGKPCIWLANEDPATYKTWDQSWLSYNSVIVNVTWKLYEVQAPAEEERDM